MAEGRVYLVGAGPGDPDLLTVRAARVMGRADVVAYDDLVHPDVLTLAPARAERLAVGKRGGVGGTRQESIHVLLVERAKRGLCVVRLKGGDPFLFGRGGEEVLALARAGVAFEVVPGLSSALAAPLVAGIPLTHRDLSATVVISTGHRAQGGPPDWRALSAVAADGTLVLLMAMTGLQDAVVGLLGAGLGPATPAAAVQWATWPNQRTVRAPLADLPRACRAAALAAPAVVVMGATVNILADAGPCPNA